MKHGLKRLEQIWWLTRNEVVRKSYRVFMKSYALAVKVAKKEFYATSIVSASCHPAQGFRVNRFLTSVTEKKQMLGIWPLAARLLQVFLPIKSGHIAMISWPLRCLWIQYLTT